MQSYEAMNMSTWIWNFWDLEEKVNLGFTVHGQIWIGKKHCSSGAEVEDGRTWRARRQGREEVARGDDLAAAVVLHQICLRGPCLRGGVHACMRDGAVIYGFWLMATVAYPMR